MRVIRRLFLILLLIILITLTLFAGLGFVNYVKTTSEVSISEEVEEIKNKKFYVTYDKINEELLQAMVVIENQRFCEHHGVEHCSMTRALHQSMLAGQIRGGGSTITQQLAEDMYHTYQSSYLRKVGETFTTYDLEEELNKEEILELYVNVVNYGDNYIGIKAANEGYSHKEPKDLMLDEATPLTDLPQSPASYQLSNHESAVRSRQIQALSTTIREDMIDKQQKAAVIEQVGK